MRDVAKHRIEKCENSPEGAVQRIYIFLEEQKHRCEFMEAHSDDHDGPELDFKSEREVYEQVLQYLESNFDSFHRRDYDSYK